MNESCIYGPLMEEWIDIPSYEGIYKISNYGLLKSMSRYVFQKQRTYIINEKLLNNNLDTHGYVYGFLYMGKGTAPKRIKTHKEMCKLFIGKLGKNLWVNHKNGIRNDNFILNLEICNPRENITHGYTIGGNRKKKTSKYVGVSWSKARNKWISSFGYNKRTIHLGAFDEESDANIEYQKAIIKYRIENKYA